jgi:Predicted transcriptional regulators
MPLRIKELLKERNLQVSELANRIDLSPQNLSKLINEKTKPSIETFERIASALNVPISDLFEQPAQNIVTCPNCGTRLKVEKD